MKKILSFFLLSTLFFLSGCSQSQNIGLKVGVVEGLGEDIMQTVQKNAAQENFDFEIVVFKDYIEINTALKQKKIDINCFQDKLHLDKVNYDLGTDFVSIGRAYLAPLGLYSQKAGLKNLHQQSKLAISDNPISMARALFLLEQNGYLRLSKSESFLPDLADIEENSKDLQIIVVNPTKIQEVFTVFDFVFLDLNHARSLGLHPTSAILLENTDCASTYLLVTRQETSAHPTVTKFIKFYNSQQTKNFILKAYNDYLIPAW